MFTDNAPPNTYPYLPIIYQDVDANSIYSIFNDEQIIGYSSIEDIIQQLNYPIDKYTRIIFFDSEVTRKDIIEISEKVNKSKIQYVHNINELENVLNNTK